MYSARMKKIFYITGVIVIACVIASSAIESMTTPSDLTRATADGRDHGIENTVYVLTCKDDRMVAYVKGAEAPFIETTTPISSLPHDVQMRLRKGIEFTSESELKRIIEEYSS